MHVVVVGGGIVGLASAYYLGRRGADVTVCERGSLGAGSTERAVGGIRTQFSTPVNVDLSLSSLDVWESFEERFGVDVAFRQPGYLFLAREEATADRFRETVAMQRDRGVPSELCSPAEAREHCPELHADSFVAATYCPRDGFADPHLALQGFSTAAREVGVDVRTNTPVTVLRRAGDGTGGNGGQSGNDDRPVVGVETPDGSIAADAVVNAAGPWAREVAAMAGVEVPVAPRRRQVAVVDPSRPVPESVALTIDLDTGAYFRPEREGRALVGGHFADEPDPASTRIPADADPDAFGTGMDVEWAATAVERAADCAGYFGPETRIRRGWAGLYAVTPDHHPILEETVPGFVQAVGFSGHGFQHAPATGRIVADLCLDGGTDLVDVDPLASERFADGEGHEEHNVA